MIRKVTVEETYKAMPRRGANNFNLCCARWSSSSKYFDTVHGVISESEEGASEGAARIGAIAALLPALKRHLVGLDEALPWVVQEQAHIRKQIAEYEALLAQDAEHKET